MLQPNPSSVCLGWLASGQRDGAGHFLARDHRHSGKVFLRHCRDLPGNRLQTLMVLLIRTMLCWALGSALNEPSNPMRAGVGRSSAVSPLRLFLIRTTSLSACTQFSVRLPVVAPVAAWMPSRKHACGG